MTGDVKTLFNTDVYAVIEGKIKDETGDLIDGYQILNKKTGVIESETTLLPKAAHIAESLTEGCYEFGLFGLVKPDAKTDTEDAEIALPH